MFRLGHQALWLERQAARQERGGLHTTTSHSLRNVFSPNLIILTPPEISPAHVVDKDVANAGRRSPFDVATCFTICETASPPPPCASRHPSVFHEEHFQEVSLASLQTQTRICLSTQAGDGCESLIGSNAGEDFLPCLQVERGAPSRGAKATLPRGRTQSARCCGCRETA